MPYSTIFVEIRPQDNNNNIHKIMFFLNTKGKIEKPNKKVRILPQCHNCQVYGPPKTTKKHQKNECTKDKHSPAKCALCTKDHTTNFKGRQHTSQLTKYNPPQNPISQSVRSSYSIHSQIIRRSY